MVFHSSDDIKNSIPEEYSKSKDARFKMQNKFNFLQKRNRELVSRWREIVENGDYIND